MSTSIPKNPVVSRQVKQDQAQLDKLNKGIALGEGAIKKIDDLQASTDAKILAEEQAHPELKTQLEAEKKKLDAEFKSKEQTLKKKLGEEQGQATALEGKIKTLLKTETDAQARGFHWAPGINDIATADGKKLGADEKKLAAEKKADAATLKQIDGQIDKLEKADPSNKAKYEELRGQLKDQVAQREKAMADAVKADKAAVGELQGEVDARSKYVKTRMAKLRKDVKTKYANAIKAAANDPAKVQKLLAAEKKAMARLDKKEKWLDGRGTKAQTAVNQAKQGKAAKDLFPEDNGGAKSSGGKSSGGGKSHGGKSAGGKSSGGKASGGKSSGGKANGSTKYGEPWKKGSGQLEGTDTSQWQSNSTFQNAIKGQKFAAIKATQGTGFVDPTFRSRWNELGKLVDSGKMKLRVAYCFLDKGNGAAQAKHFLDTLGIHGKLKPGTRLALDWEASALSSPQTLKDAANYIHKVTGLWPLVYTSASQAGRAKAAVPNAPMWEAQWTGGKSNHNVPFVQYSDGGGGLDHDVFNGDVNALERFAGWK